MEDALGTINAMKNKTLMLAISLQDSQYQVRLTHRFINLFHLRVRMLLIAHTHALTWPDRPLIFDLQDQIALICELHAVF